MLTAFVTVGYVVLVVGAGPARGRPAAGTSVVASVVVALAFQPLRRRVTAAGRPAGVRRAGGALRRPGRAQRGAAARDCRSTRCCRGWPRRPAGRSGPSRCGCGSTSRAGTPLRAGWHAGRARRRGRRSSVSSRSSTAASGLGGLSVAMARGRGLRPAERELLATFADQLATAFRARRLESALAARVDLLACRREQLERSRLRLLSAQSVERLRFESAIAKEVLPHLADLPDDLHRLVEESQAGPGRRRGWSGSSAGSPTRSESLRTLTRGVFPAQLARQGVGGGADRAPGARPASGTRSTWTPAPSTVLAARSSRWCTSARSSCSARSTGRPGCCSPRRSDRLSLTVAGAPSDPERRHRPPLGPRRGARAGPCAPKSGRGRRTGAGGRRGAGRLRGRARARWPRAARGRRLTCRGRRPHPSARRPRRTR